MRARLPVTTSSPVAPLTRRRGAPPRGTHSRKWRRHGTPRGSCDEAIDAVDRPTPCTPSNARRTGAPAKAPALPTLGQRRGTDLQRGNLAERLLRRVDLPQATCSPRQRQPERPPHLPAREATTLLQPLYAERPASPARIAPERLHPPRQNENAATPLQRGPPHRTLTLRPAALPRQNVSRRNTVQL